VLLEPKAASLPPHSNDALHEDA